MAYGFLDTLSTPSIHAAQAAMGADHLWRNERIDRAFDAFGPNEAAFIARRDSFYMATVAENGWPYVQHRGGPAGFLKVIDPKTLAFADYRGNRQYLSLGNLGADDRVSLILVDYPARARLKILAHAEAVSAEAEPELAAKVATPGYAARAERILKLSLVAFDWNCPQHIMPRFTEAEISQAVQPLRARLVQLEAENADLRAKLSAVPVAAG